jgi:hypothetical protein
MDGAGVKREVIWSKAWMTQEQGMKRVGEEYKGGRELRPPPNIAASDTKEGSAPCTTSHTAPLLTQCIHETNLKNLLHRESKTTAVNLKTLAMEKPLLNCQHKKCCRLSSDTCSHVRLLLQFRQPEPFAGSRFRLGIQHYVFFK